DSVVRSEDEVHAGRLEHRAIALESARITLEVVGRPELEPVHEDRHGDGLRAAWNAAAREAHQREMSVVQVAHGRDERERAAGTDCGAQLLGGAQDLHQPRLKNSRRLFMPRMRLTSSSKSGSRSTKFRFSEFTISTGAAA